MIDPLTVILKSDDQWRHYWYYWWHYSYWWRIDPSSISILLVMTLFIVIDEWPVFSDGDTDIWQFGVTIGDNPNDEYCWWWPSCCWWKIDCPVDSFVCCYVCWSHIHLVRFTSGLPRWSRSIRSRFRCYVLHVVVPLICSGRYVVPSFVPRSSPLGALLILTVIHCWWYYWPSPIDWPVLTIDDRPIHWYIDVTWCCWWPHCYWREQ